MRKLAPTGSGIRKKGKAKKRSSFLLFPHTLCTNVQNGKEEKNGGGGKQTKRTTPFSSFLDPISQKSVFSFGSVGRPTMSKAQKAPKHSFTFWREVLRATAASARLPLQKPNIKGSLDSKVSDFTAGGGGGRHSRCLVQGILTDLKSICGRKEGGSLAKQICRVGGQGI